MTIEEFHQLPKPVDGSQQELVRRVVITMPPPKGFHGLCCVNVVSVLAPFVKKNQLGHLTCNGTGFILERNPDTVRGPDVAFWNKDRLAELPEDEFISIPPDLTVEVVSPHDTHSRLQDKVLQYVKCGVKMIWLSDPHQRIVTVYRSLSQSQVLENGDTLSGEDVLPGFSCLVSELFV